MDHLLRRSLLSLVLIVGTLGCREDQRRLAADTTYAHETVRYEELLHAQLTATDVRAANRAVSCENLRLVRVLGLDRVNKAVAPALARYHRTADPVVLEHVEQALAQGVFSIDEGACEKLAKAGVLGDTTWPKQKIYYP